MNKLNNIYKYKQMDKENQYLTRTFNFLLQKSAAWLRALITDA